MPGPGNQQPFYQHCWVVRPFLVTKMTTPQTGSPARCPLGSALFWLKDPESYSGVHNAGPGVSLGGWSSRSCPLLQSRSARGPWGQDKGHRSGPASWRGSVVLTRAGRLAGGSKQPCAEVEAPVGAGVCLGCHGPSSRAQGPGRWPHRKRVTSTRPGSMHMYCLRLPLVLNTCDAASTATPFFRGSKCERRPQHRRT